MKAVSEPFLGRERAEEARGTWGQWEGERPTRRGACPQSGSLKQMEGRGISSLMAQCLQPAFQFDRQGDRGQERGHLVGRQQGLIYLPDISSQKPARPVLLPVPIPSPSHPRLRPGPSSPHHLLSYHLSLSHQLPGCKAPVCPPAARLLSPTSPTLERVCVCMCARTRVGVCTGHLPLFLPQVPTPAHPTLSAPQGPGPSAHMGLGRFLFLPVSPCFLPSLSAPPVI